MQDNGPVISLLQQETSRKSFAGVTSLLNYLELDAGEAPYKILTNTEFPFKVTRSYATKIIKGDWYDPLLLQCLPRGEEALLHDDYKYDPVGDKEATVLPGLIHKYKNRVLLTVSPECSMHCRYCFRKNYDYNSFTRSDSEWTMIYRYIEDNKNINEVILSGGDPLTVSNSQLKDIFDSIEAIPHVNTLRIHSRIPAISPHRINLNFMRLLSEYQNSGLSIVMVHHINHPGEIGTDNTGVFENLKRAGVLQFNQSVLLKHVNDNESTLVKLSRKLLACGIVPYYLHQLDQVEGTRHFYVSPDKGKAIIREMQSEMQGYGIPRYVCEIPERASKTPIA